MFTPQTGTPMPIPEESDPKSQPNLFRSENRLSGQRTVMEWNINIRSWLFLLYQWILRFVGRLPTKFRRNPRGGNSQTWIWVESTEQVTSLHFSFFPRISIPNFHRDFLVFRLILDSSCFGAFSLINRWNSHDFEWIQPISDRRLWKCEGIWCWVVPATRSLSTGMILFEFSLNSASGTNKTVVPAFLDWNKLLNLNVSHISLWNLYERFYSNDFTTILPWFLWFEFIFSMKSRTLCRVFVGWMFFLIILLNSQLKIANRVCVRKSSQYLIWLSMNYRTETLYSSLVDRFCLCDLPLILKLWLSIFQHS